MFCTAVFLFVGATAVSVNILTHDGLELRVPIDLDAQPRLVVAWIVESAISGAVGNSGTRVLLRRVSARAFEE